MTAESKKLLNLIASETATHLLNKRIFADSLAIGEFVYVIDLLIAKHPNSIIDSLARVIESKEGRNYALQLLNKEIITQHITSLLTTKANFHNVKHQNIDIFQIHTCHDIIIPSQLSSKFYKHIQAGLQFKLQVVNEQF